MKKLILIPIVLIGLFTSCTSVHETIMNVTYSIDSTTMKVGDSVYVCVSNTPKKEAYIEMSLRDSALCDVVQLTDTSAMVYAKKEGYGTLQAIFLVDHLTYTSSVSKFIPIKVIGTE